MSSGIAYEKVKLIIRGIRKRCILALIYSDCVQPIEMKTYPEARSISVSSSDDEQDPVKFRKLTWAATAK